MERNKELFSLTLTREQLVLIAQCVEDCHRFAAGQTEMWNTLVSIDKKECTKVTSELKSQITPELLRASIASWNGRGLKNKDHRAFVGKTYPIYREIYHRLTKIDGEKSVYNSSTLTCEYTGRLIQIEKK